MRRLLPLLLALLAVPQAALAGQTELIPARRPAIGSQQDADLILILTRSTLIGLHRANVSGNYSTLRDLAAPRLKERFTAADLSLAFTALRRHGINLEASAILQPVYAPAPYIDEYGALRIAGWMGTAPENVVFDMAFEAVHGSWALLDISVKPSGALPAEVPVGESSFGESPMAANPQEAAMPGLLSDIRRGADRP
jgi:hypothetical protein